MTRLKLNNYLLFNLAPPEIVFFISDKNNLGMDLKVENLLLGRLPDGLIIFEIIDATFMLDNLF